MASTSRRAARLRGRSSATPSSRPAAGRTPLLKDGWLASLKRVLESPATGERGVDMIWLSRRVIVCSVLLLVPAESLHADTFRLSCTGIQGARIQHVLNPLVLPEQYGKTVVEDDAVTGMTIEVTYSSDRSEATIVMHGNKNAEGRVYNYNAVSIMSGSVRDFYWIDNSDGSRNMMSYLQNIGKCFWSVHNDKIFKVERVAIGKLFICSCVKSRI